MLGDSFIFQLLPIVHETQSSFDYNAPIDVRAIFLYISKTFGKVWHQDLLLKLKPYVENYIDNRNQKLMLDGQCSS